MQRTRIAARKGDASEADLEVFKLQLERQEALAGDELDYTLWVDTTGEPALAPLLHWLNTG